MSPSCHTQRFYKGFIKLYIYIYIYTYIYVYSNTFVTSFRGLKSKCCCQLLQKKKNNVFCLFFVSVSTTGSNFHTVFSNKHNTYYYTGSKNLYYRRMPTKDKKFLGIERTGLQKKIYVSSLYIGIRLLCKTKLIYNLKQF